MVGGSDSTPSAPGLSSRQPRAIRHTSSCGQGRSSIDLHWAARPFLSKSDTTAAMKGRPDPTEDARQRLMTLHLLFVIVALVGLVVGLLLRRLGMMG